MADSSIPITPGTGADVDTRTAPDGNHRQVVAIGDPAAADVVTAGVRGAVASATAVGIPAMAVRHDSDSAVVDDGDYSMLHTDEEGRVKVSSKTASFTVTTGTLTTSGNTLVCDVRRASNVVLHVKNTGSSAMSAGQFAFEASIDSTNGTDGTWFGIQACRSSANTVEAATGTLSIAAGAGLAYSWEASVNAYQWVRVRCTTTVTTNSVATWTIQRGSYATEPVPAIQTHSVTAAAASFGATTTPATPTPTNFTSAATTNLTSVKSSAGTLYGIAWANNTAATVYLKLYNKTSAPVPASDTPIFTVPIAAGAVGGLGVAQLGVLGHRFATGIAFSVTGALAKTDTTAIATGLDMLIDYI